jgi:hypothetical protein
MAADEAALTAVRGLGRRKAARIREVAGDPAPPHFRGAIGRGGDTARAGEADPDGRVASEPANDLY